MQGCPPSWTLVSAGAMRRSVEPRQHRCSCRTPPPPVTSKRLGESSTCHCGCSRDASRLPARAAVETDGASEVLPVPPHEWPWPSPFATPCRREPLFYAPAGPASRRA